MTTKKTKSSAVAVVADQNADTKRQQDDASIVNDEATIPTGSSVPVGTNTSAADGTADAHDQAGGDAANPPADLATALVMTGCVDLENLVDMANVGISLISAIAAYTVIEGPLKNWAPADGPAEVVGHLVAQIEVLQERVAELAKLNAPMGTDFSAGAIWSAEPSDVDLEQSFADQLADLDLEEAYSYFAARYPLISATLAAFEGVHGKAIVPSAIKVTSERDGFRRAGLIHTRQPREYQAGEISAEQIETLLADPVLTVEVI